MKRIFNCSTMRWNALIFICGMSAIRTVTAGWNLGVYDTGEDNAKRYGNAPCWWEDTSPPKGYDVVPINHMDFMSFSYSACDTFSRISVIMKIGKTEYWMQQVKQVSDKILSFLWRDERGACFDRDSMASA